MSIFGIFRRKTKEQSESPESKIEFEFRGEGITYSLRDKYLHLGIAWVKESTLYTPRLYTETMNKWEDGSILKQAEKKRVFSEVVHFIAQKHEKPIIVINSNDTSRDFWENLCSVNLSLIAGLEYPSLEEYRHFNRKFYLDFIESGKRVIINRTEIRNKKELDQFMQNSRKRHAA
jgi:hypothetical protein